jgi:hypothetical protein
MCILILLRGLHREYPILVGGNRDERTDRKAAPPGLWVGQHHRILSPRDRVAGGTWMAIDERGWFAGLTNIAGAPAVPNAPSRGLLPHLALDEPDLEAAVAMVQARVRAAAHAGFQLVLCDGQRTFVLRHARGELRVEPWSDPVLVVTNEHAPGELALRGLGAALLPELSVEARLDALAPLLRDRGEGGHHPVCKRGDGYGTVSSSLLAVPARGGPGLLWRYAPGPPDVTPYRNYGNLERRLLPDDEFP